MPEHLNIEKELKDLNSHLPVQAPHTPYSVPIGYFEGLAGQVLDRIRREEIRSELESISPLLSKLNRSTPYTTPVGYFENQPASSAVQPPPVISMVARSWFRYAVAAAAVIAGIFFWVGRSSDQSTQTNTVMSDYQKVIQQLSEQQQAQLSEFVEAGMTGQDTTQLGSTRSVQADLLADVSEQEMSEFFEQSEYITSTSVND